MTDGFRIRRLNHAVLFVSELHAAGEFYRGTLGFETVSEDDRSLFLRAAGSDNHHDLGLFALGAGAPGPGRGQTGLYHLAWQVDTIDELVEARRLLLEAGAFVGESSHGATKSVYARDPDGNELEIMWMIPRAEWGEYATKGVVEPLDLAGDVSRWSGVATAAELT